MTTLASAVSIGDNQLLIDTPLAAGQVPGWVKIDSEMLNVGGQHFRTGTTLVLSEPAQAAHSQGATVTYAGNPFDPTFVAATAGGAAGVTIDNTVDPPAAVTSIVASGSTITGSEATLLGKDFYAQDDDPGAVGAGSVWKETNPTGYTWWERNQANDGWDPIVDVVVTATGSVNAIATRYAESVDGLADANSTALASGDGIAQAKSNAEASGAGQAESGPSAESVDGLATVNATATATGTGDAEAGSFATSNTGTARASALAFRGAATAGMAAEIDGTSARMAFNGTTPIAIPVIPASPTAQQVADVIVALGLATQGV